MANFKSKVNKKARRKVKTAYEKLYRISGSNCKHCVTKIQGNRRLACEDRKSGTFVYDYC